MKHKKEFFKILILIILAVIITGCGNYDCVEADDWGYPKIHVPAGEDYGLQASQIYNPNTNNEYIDPIDSGQVIIDAANVPMVITVSDGDQWTSWWGIPQPNTSGLPSALNVPPYECYYYDTNPGVATDLAPKVMKASNQTDTMTFCTQKATGSKIPPVCTIPPPANDVFAAMQDYNGTAQEVTNIQALQRDNFADYFAPCNLMYGMGLYVGLAFENGPQDQIIVTQHIPDAKNPSYVYYRNDSLANIAAGAQRDGYLINGMPASEILGAETNDRLYFKILDQHYEDNQGGYYVRIKAGTRSPNQGPFESTVHAFQQPVNSLMIRLYGGIVDNPVFINGVRAMLVLFVVFYAYMFMMGMIKDEKNNFIINVLKIGILIELISPNSWEFFYNYLFTFFLNGSAEAAGLLLHPVSFIGYDPSSPWYSVDQAMAMFFSAETWAKMSSLVISNADGFVYMLIYILSVIFFFFILVKAVMIYLAAYITMAILVVMTPITLMLWLFSKTKHFFDEVITQFFAFAIQIVLLFAGVGMFLYIITTSMEQTIGYRTCWDSIFNISFADYSIINFKFWEPDIRNIKQCMWVESNSVISAQVQAAGNSTLNACTSTAAPTCNVSGATPVCPATGVPPMCVETTSISGIYAAKCSDGSTPTCEPICASTQTIPGQAYVLRYEDLPYFEIGSTKANNYLGNKNFLQFTDVIIFVISLILMRGFMYYIPTLSDVLKAGTGTPWQSTGIYGGLNKGINKGYSIAGNITGLFRQFNPLSRGKDGKFNSIWAEAFGGAGKWYEGVKPKFAPRKGGAGAKPAAPAALSAKGGAALSQQQALAALQKGGAAVGGRMGKLKLMHDTEASNNPAAQKYLQKAMGREAQVMKGRMDTKTRDFMDRLEKLALEKSTIGIFGKYGANTQYSFLDHVGKGFAEHRNMTRSQLKEEMQKTRIDLASHKLEKGKADKKDPKSIARLQAKLNYEEVKAKKAGSFSPMERLRIHNERKAAKKELAVARRDERIAEAEKFGGDLGKEKKKLAEKRFNKADKESINRGKARVRIEAKIEKERKNQEALTSAISKDGKDKMAKIDAAKDVKADKSAFKAADKMGVRALYDLDKKGLTPDQQKTYLRMKASEEKVEALKKEKQAVHDSANWKNKQLASAKENMGKGTAAKDAAMLHKKADTLNKMADGEINRDSGVRQLRKAELEHSVANKKANDYLPKDKAALQELADLKRSERIAEIKAMENISEKEKEARTAIAEKQYKLDRNAAHRINFFDKAKDTVTSIAMKYDKDNLNYAEKERRLSELDAKDNRNPETGKGNLSQEAYTLEKKKINAEYELAKKNNQAISFGKDKLAEKIENYDQRLQKQSKIDELQAVNNSLGDVAKKDFTDAQNADFKRNQSEIALLQKEQQLLKGGDLLSRESLQREITEARFQYNKDSVAADFVTGKISADMSKLKNEKNNAEYQLEKRGQDLINGPINERQKEIKELEIRKYDKMIEIQAKVESGQISKHVGQAETKLAEAQHNLYVKQTDLIGANFDRSEVREVAELKKEASYLALDDNLRQGKISPELADLHKRKIDHTYEAEYNGAAYIQGVQGLKADYHDQRAAAFDDKIKLQEQREELTAVKDKGIISQDLYDLQMKKIDLQDKMIDSDTKLKADAGYIIDKVADRIIDKYVPDVSDQTRLAKLNEQIDSLAFNEALSVMEKSSPGQSAPEVTKYNSSYSDINKPIPDNDGPSESAPEVAKQDKPKVEDKPKEESSFGIESILDAAGNYVAGGRGGQSDVERRIAAEKARNEASASALSAANKTEKAAIEAANLAAAKAAETDAAKLASDTEIAKKLADQAKKKTDEEPST